MTNDPFQKGQKLKKYFGHFICHLILGFHIPEAKRPIYCVWVGVTQGWSKIDQIILRGNS